MDAWASKHRHAADEHSSSIGGTYTSLDAGKKINALDYTTRQKLQQCGKSG